MLQELIKVNSQPAIINVNFDELKAALQKDLEKYDVLVTIETLSDAKKLATELNKTKKIIDDQRKAEVAKVSGPVKKFDDDMKALVKMCADGREKITSQVKRFEDETKQAVAKSLSGARDFLWGKYKVEPEFFRAEYDDLIKISAFTATGKLTKSVKDDLERRVIDDKRIQDRTNMRLVQLENQSFKAGLSAPLTRDHVNTFLFAEEDAYQSEIDRIIASEIERQKVAEEATRKKLAEEQRRKDEEIERKHQQQLDEQKRKAEAEQQAAVEAAKEPVVETIEVLEPAITEPPATPAAEEKPIEESPEPASCEISCRITCTFDLDIPATLSNEVLEKALRAQMEKAGINKLSSLEIERGGELAAA